MARSPALVAALLVAGSAPAAAVEIAKPPRMAFVTPQGGAFDVWTGRLDGSEMRKLTHTKAYDSFPAWSPNGRRIVFVSDRRAVGKLWVVNADGRGLRRLTRGGSKDADPAWSPKGSLIAYASTARLPGIWLVRPDGTHARPLRRRGVGGGAPSWSPNARQIAFAARCAQDALHTCVYAISASGTRRRQLTRPANDDDDWAPAWSPDGLQIVWMRGPELWIMNADGSSPHKLHPAGEWPDDSPPYDTYPSWSPDGSRVLFGTTYSPSGIAVVNRDGSGFSPVAAGAIKDGIYPAWRPR
jgi:Tol biopolymer transport system component